MNNSTGALGEMGFPGGFSAVVFVCYAGIITAVMGKSTSSLRMNGIFFLLRLKPGRSSIWWALWKR